MEKFVLEKLPYKYEDLEPYISKETLMVHHDKHHQAYCDKFNVALETLSINSNKYKEIFSNVSDKPAIRNNGGGFWNHTFYWESMSASCDGPDKLPEIKLAIEKSFGSFDKFKEEFSNAAATRFGSGWAWLAVKNDGSLIIYSTENQDNFMMDICVNKEIPILVIDVWEHAYYIDYQNKRPEYIENFFKVINWNKVNDRLKEIISN